MRADPVPFARLRGGDVEAVSDFCDRLHVHGYALLRFAPEAEAEVAALRSAAAAFFELPKADKAMIGDFRFIGDTYAGYRDSVSCDSEFLEVHTIRAGGTYPPLANPAGMSEVAAALHRRLDGMARYLLKLLAAHLGIDAQALLAPLDPPVRAELAVLDREGEELSSSVLRVCHYRAQPEDGGGDGSVDGGAAIAATRSGDGEAKEEEEVLFDAHTDSSLLTLSTLCPRAPGLQLQDGGEWLSVERFEGVEVGWVRVRVRVRVWGSGSGLGFRLGLGLG